MARCILIGAGASYGASRFDTFRCPLVTGILPSAVSLGFFDPKYSERRHAVLRAELLAAAGRPEVVEEMLPEDDQHLEILTAFIRDHFGVEPADYHKAQIDFERLFALTEAAILGWHGFLRATGQHPRGASPTDVLDMQIKLVLCGSIIAAIRDLRCDYHDVVARWLQRGDAVISFNYDLLMERSLRATGQWFMDDGYFIPFHRHGVRSDAVDDRVVWRERRSTSSNVMLLKPHGSLNWLYPRNSWDSVMNMSLHGGVNRIPSRQLFCLDDVYPRFEEDYPTYEWWERYDIQEGETILDLHSLIVPPSLSKPYRDYESYMGPVWGAAAGRLLASTTELFIVGYSLRNDDVRTHHLLRQASVASSALARVCVVDPSCETLQRAEKLFAPRKVEHLANSMEDFAILIAKGVA